MKNFWQDMPRPILALAPMEDVTDAAFRRLIAKKATMPYVTYTEFTSADGLVLADEKGQKKLRRKLVYSEIERPIVAQLFTAVPEHMEKACALAHELGFDGVDINMGCPDRAIEKSGCGSAMIKTPHVAREVIRAAKRGAGDIPVSVKTRLGYNKDELETWLPALLAEEPAAVTLHLRTRKEMSLVPARWERLVRAVEIRDELRSDTLILGNGDLQDVADAREHVDDTGADGAMLGRAVFGNPWLFANRTEEPTPQERIEALIEHLKLFDELMADVTHFAIMKKHFKAYISGWPNAAELRAQLMETNDATSAIEVLQANLYVPELTAR